MPMSDTDDLPPLQLSEAQLRQIIDLVPHMIFVKDRTGRFLLVNEAKAVAHGTTVRQLTGRRHSELYPDPSVLEGMLSDDQQVIVTGRAKFIAEESFVDGAGNRRLLETIKIPYRIPDYDEPVVLGVATDITERRRVEQALEREERRHREVLNALDEGVAMIGADGTVYSCNPGAERILGRSSDELIGRPWQQDRMRRITETGAPFAKHDHPIGKTLNTGAAFDNVVMGLVGPDDAVTWLSINTRPKFRDGERRPYAVVVSLRDITEHKRVEAALRASEEWLRRSQIFANVGSWDWNLKTDALRWSERVGPMFGYPHPVIDTTVDAFWKAVHPRDLPRVAAAVSARIDRDVDYDIEYRVIWPDGTVRWIHARGDLVRNAAGEALRMAGVLQDVTARRQAEEALRTSERKYRVLMEHASDGIAIADMQGNYLDANRRMEELLGYTKSELLGMKVREIHPPEEWGKVQDAFRNINEQGKSLCEHLVVRKDGSTAPVEVAGTLIEFENQKVALGIFRDVSERKRAEQTMAKLSSALEQTADSIMITDAQGRIEYVNSGFEATTGYRRAEVLGRTPRVLKSGCMGPTFYSRMWRRILKGRVLRCVFTNRKKDGSLFYEDKTISPLRDEHGRITHFISSARDVTDRTRAEQERVARETAHRDLLVREVHHRIKNHLQGLTGLLRQHSTRHPEIAEPLQAVISQIHSMAMVHGLQGTAGHGRVCICDMTEAICTSIGALRGAGRAPLLDRQLPGPIQVAQEEAVSLALVLNELIINGVKYAVPDEPGGDAVQVAVSAADGGVEVVVRNGGASLPPDFDFPNRAGLGTGLGLVHALLPRNGAELTFSQRGAWVQALLTLRPPLIRLNDVPYGLQPTSN